MSWRRVALVVLAASAVLGACGTTAEQLMPSCSRDPRLAILAQSVPDAAYVPCITDLPTGWSFEGLHVDDDGATISLESDRADRPVEVELAASCDVAEAMPITPSDEGVRTHHLVESIEPRYAGRFFDVFPGGCVISTYDFERGPHVALITEMQAAVGLFTRLELRQVVAAELDVRLDR